MHLSPQKLLKPGKHPRTSHGVRDATTSTETVHDWLVLLRWPDANRAIAIGFTSGLVVLDIDPRHGGDEGLEVFLRQHGPLPHTVSVATDGGGRHS